MVLPNSTAIDSTIIPSSSPDHKSPQRTTPQYIQQQIEFVQCLLQRYPFPTKIYPQLIQQLQTIQQQFHDRDAPVAILSEFPSEKNAANSNLKCNRF